MSFVQIELSSLFYIERRYMHTIGYRYFKQANGKKKTLKGIILILETDQNKFLDNISFGC